MRIRKSKRMGTSRLVKRVMSRLFNCPYAHVCVKDGDFKEGEICPIWESNHKPCEGVEEDVREYGDGEETST